MPQTVEYRRKMVEPERFKVFVVHGDACELGESFIYRLGYFNLSFELKKYYLDLIGLLDSTTSAPALRLNILFLMYDMLLPGQAEKEPHLSPARIVEVVRTVHRKPFTLYVRLPDGYWSDGVRALKGLMAEFRDTVRADPAVQLVWFVLAEDVPEERLLAADACVLAPAPDAPVYVLPQLRAFSKELVGTWVQEYLTEVPSAKRKILDTYFPSLKRLPTSQRTCQTEDVEAELLDIFQKLDQADEALYQLL